MTLKDNKGRLKKSLLDYNIGWADCEEKHKERIASLKKQIDDVRKYHKQYDDAYALQAVLLLDGIIKIIDEEMGK